MDSVFVPGVDDQFRKASKSWQMIQRAWSGGVCVGKELFVWGGGHGDGAHNGLLAVNVHTGTWRRVTEPSPIWTSETCPDNRCPAVTGSCALGTCNTGPDGRPVARHTYQLMASDGGSIYIEGGGIWFKGSHGDPYSAWRFDLETVEWSRFDKSPVSKPHGNLRLVDGRLYHVTAQGFATYEVATGRWQKDSKARGFGGQTSVVYVPDTDRFYAIGNGRALTVLRTEWGARPDPIADAPAVIAEKYVGAVYYPPEQKILIWNGGPTITTLDPRTHRWGAIIPAGDPGPVTTKGVLGRFNYCDGRVVLVNGTDRDLHVLGVRDETMTVASPEPKKAPRPRPKKTAGRSRDEKEPSQVPAPYYATPPGDELVRRDCGPMSEWEHIDVTTDADVASLRKRIKKSTRAVIRVHHRAAAYPVLRIKGGRCVKVEGVPSDAGELPVVGGVNATKAFRGSTRPGGLILEQLDISPGKARRRDPDIRVSANCIGVPNDQSFLIIRDSAVSRCRHHAFVTSHAHQLYVEIGRSHFEQAGSHLAYIDHIAMAYVYDSTFQSPGWGHALRCVALRCVMEGVKVSNVALDGTVLPRGGDNPLQPKRRYVGMAPLEIYSCGEHEIRNSDIVFRADKRANAGFAAIVRGREAFQTCDVGEVRDGTWTRLAWGDPDFASPARWQRVTPLVTRIDSMRVTCAGPEPCSAWSIRGNYPTMNDAQKRDLVGWLKDNSFDSWSGLVRAVPKERTDWAWLTTVTLPGFRDDFRQGRVTNKVPLPVPSTWTQRTRVSLTNVTVEGGDVLQEPKSVRTYCYGEAPSGSGDNLSCTQQFDGARYRQGFVTVSRAGFN